MRLLSTIAFLGMLTLILSACGSEETASNTTANNTEVKQPASVQPTTSTQLLAQKPAPETAVNSSTTAQKPQNQASSTAGLIPPTNVNQRTQQVLTGRPDPFAGLFAIPKPPVAVQPRRVVPSLPKLPATSPPRPKPVVVQPLKPAPLKPAPLPPVIPPPPPQPDLARGVVVLGVIEAGNQLQAIVQVPNEATSRYISEGQRLSDGQVLVKRIEINAGAEPLVILEQNGVEVTRTVGEEPVQPAQNQPPQTTGAIPVRSPIASSITSTQDIETKLPTAQQRTSAIPVPQLPPSDPNSVAQLKSLLPPDPIPDATPVTPDATPVTPDATPITPDATQVTPDATAVTPDATPITPDTTQVTSDATAVTPDATPITSDTTPPSSSDSSSNEGLIRKLREEELKRKLNID